MNTLYEIYLKHPQVFIDTRKELTQGLFFAVGQKDEHGAHRGNQFAEMALSSGKAAYAVINDPRLKAKHADDKRFILVKDGEVALQDLAREHRKQLRLPIIAIAGSNGKTTTKELLDKLLALKYKTFSTRGNLNNHLGVPLSILSIDNSLEIYEMAILEIGANHLDETRFLTEIVSPSYGLVTNCGKDHLGEYGSMDNVIKANKELYDVLAEQGKAAFVFNHDNLLVEMSKSVGNRIFYGADANCHADILETPFLKIRLHRNTESIEIQTHLFGRFWLDILLGVAAIGQHFGMSLKEIKLAFESYQPAALRSQLIEWQGNKVLLDCYNANPSSMEAFLAEIHQSNLEESKILVLGEMLELGQYSKEEHQNLVKSIDWEKFEEVILVGKEFGVLNLPIVKNLLHLSDKTEVQQHFQEKKYQGKYIFVKGSRGNRLEAIFE